MIKITLSCSSNSNTSYLFDFVNPAETLYSVVPISRMILSQIVNFFFHRLHGYVTENKAAINQYYNL